MTPGQHKTLKGEEKMPDLIRSNKLSYKYALLSMIETLQEVAYQHTAEVATTQLPDPVLTQDALEKYSYLDSNLLAFSKERAYELMDSALGKLQTMSDTEFAELELSLDFDE